MAHQESTSVLAGGGSLAGGGALAVATARPEDPEAAPLLDGLLFEYTSRYGRQATA